MRTHDGSSSSGAPLSACAAAAGAQRSRLMPTFVLVAALWVASDLGYYYLLPLVAEPVAYNAAPGTIALYYLFWVGVALAAFRPLYRSWRPFTRGWSGYLLFSASIAGLLAFATLVLPALQPVVWPKTWDPPELLRATSWYFLPKAIDILFQQLLIVALVLAFAAERCSLRAMSLCCAALFGGTHLLLAFGGVPWGYVARFTVVAAAFGLAFPTLILRVRNGFAWSYLTHWGYYAVSLIMAHTISPYAQ